MNVDIDAATKDGCTPLHFAVKYKKLEIVKALLAAGANPQILDSNGRSAIHIAARRGNIELLKVSLSQTIELEGGRKPLNKANQVLII